MQRILILQFVMVLAEVMKQMADIQIPTMTLEVFGRQVIYL